jgi:hypothetical protein
MNSKIMAIWAMIVVLACATLIFISNAHRDKDLLRLENNIKSSAKSYIKDNGIKIKIGESYVVTIDDLIDGEYMSEDENIVKYCIQKVIVSNEIIINKYKIEKECKKITN